MYTVIETETFMHWLGQIKDRVTQTRLKVRLRKATLGNLGDVKPVGEGVFEMREFFGPGWRMYYLEKAGAMVFMLGAATNPARPATFSGPSNCQRNSNEQNQNPAI